VGFVRVSLKRSIRMGTIMVPPGIHYARYEHHLRLAVNGAQEE